MLLLVVATDGTDGVHATAARPRLRTSASRNIRLTMVPRRAAIVLAAGASRRMRTPKALLTWGDGTLLDYVLHEAHRAQAEQVVVVLGHIPRSHPDDDGDQPRSRYGQKCLDPSRRLRAALAVQEAILDVLRRENA